MDPKDEGGSKRRRGGGKGGRKKGRKATMMVMAVHEKVAEVCFIQCFNDRSQSGCACQRTLAFASRRDVILVYLQYDVYDSPSPSTFVRSGPNGEAPVPLPSLETVRNYRLEDCVTIVLKSEIGDGLTGKVLRGYLMGEALARRVLDIALKIALGSERGDALRNEYRMYRILGNSGVTADHNAIGFV